MTQCNVFLDNTYILSDDTPVIFTTVLSHVIGIHFVLLPFLRNDLLRVTWDAKHTSLTQYHYHYWVTVVTAWLGCHRTQVQISPWAFAFIPTATAICSPEHWLCRLAVVPTWPAHVVQWSNHLSVMSSRAWRSQWQRFNSNLSPGTFTY